MLTVKSTMADEQSISRVFNGMTLTGTYTLQDDVVTVRTEFANKTAQLLGSHLATLASIMLRELYEDIASRGASSAKSQHDVRGVSSRGRLKALALAGLQFGRTCAGMRRPC